MRRLEYYWYTGNPWLILLTPVSLVYRLVVRARRLAYRGGFLRQHRMPVPVVVVGNITVGGTGKTPLVAWLAGFLKEAGYHPGIVARGYKGKARRWPQPVRPDSDPVMVGDEAVLLAGMSQCPVAVAPRRPEAARLLIEQDSCDLILSDDGLQHYALQRDIEIVVIDGLRRLGNGFCLPAGPLREPATRLAEVDFVVINGRANKGEYSMKMEAAGARNLVDDREIRELASFRGQSVHGVAAIGHPERFFAMLRQAGLQVEEHAFPDHHSFAQTELAFNDDRPVFMTAKDAVKCRHFPLANAWYVPVTIEIMPEFGASLLGRLGRGEPT